METTAGDGGGCEDVDCYRCFMKVAESETSNQKGFEAAIARDQDRSLSKPNDSLTTLW